MIATFKKETDFEKKLGTLFDSEIKEKGKNQLIAFRVDPDTAKRLEALEELKKKSRTELVKNAIQLSFDSQLLNYALEHLLPVVKNEFKEAKIERWGFGSYKEDDSNTNLPFHFAPDSGQVIISLPEFNISCSEVIHHLSLLDLSLSVQGLRTIKLEIVAPFIHADINKMPAELIKEIQVIASRNNLVLKTAKQGKTDTTFQLSLGKNLNFRDRWIETFTSDVKRTREALKQITGLFTNPALPTYDQNRKSLPRAQSNEAKGS